MTLGAKLAKLRRENQYTQEQLASLLGVSRQAISKWESDVAFPETEKLIRMSELYGCSLDYLLKESMEADHTYEERPQAPAEEDSSIRVTIPRRLKERKSERMLWGMPLWHIGKKARGVIAIGLDAQGIIVIGLKARGVISIGLLSLGLISIGTLSIGVFALGVLAIGIVVGGSFALGALAAGAICYGKAAFGAIAGGDFAAGAIAYGKYAAIGDHAKGMIAIGKTEAVGSLYQKIGKLSAAEVTEVKALLDANVPVYLNWAKEIMKALL